MFNKRKNLEESVQEMLDQVRDATRLERLVPIIREYKVYKAMS